MVKSLYFAFDPFFLSVWSNLYILRLTPFFSHNRFENRLLKCSPSSLRGEQVFAVIPATDHVVNRSRIFNAFLSWHKEKLQGAGQCGQIFIFCV